MNEKSRTSQGGSRLSRLKGPALVFVAGLVIFGAVSGDRLAEPSSDNHYVHLADSILHGRLHLEGKPPHLNDWAKYEGQWYVSFPPAPAFLMIPGVAVFGLDFNDRVFTLVFAALGPALLFLLIQLMVAGGRIERGRLEIAILSAIYGVGTVYFFSAVQGSVWFTAHMVGGVFLLLYAICALDARHPLLAGLFLGLAFACRPPMLFAFPFLVHEVLRSAETGEGEGGLARWMIDAVGSLGFRKVLVKLVLFGVPVAAVIGGVMVMNWVRFDDPFEFGHKLLQVRWAGRIEKWGLFHYHYLARNLTVSMALLPWLSAEEPFLGISRHGLAIWFTTPVLLWVLWPRKRTRLYTFLAITVALAALPSLLYQNSGWIQFGYRFSLDYTAFLVLMIAAGGRRFGKLFYGLSVFALVVNLFGAVTFDRMREYYPGVSTRSYFQPD